MAHLLIRRCSGTSSVLRLFSKMTEAKYNTRNPAVKRILQEMREMEQDDSCDFVAQACEENIFEWHFVIRGPPDTDFQGGLYHGRILLPPEYPFKPPSFMMLTKNGRFETNTKICLSISDYHPEHWQPSWSMRTALTALVAFLPTPGKGALGSIDMTSDVRKKLAAESRDQVAEFGTEERKKLAQDLHTKLAQRLQSSPASRSTSEQTQMTPAASEGCSLHEHCMTDPPMRRRASQSDWIWTSLTYLLGFLILAIVAKKILIKSGFSDFTSSD